MTTPLADRITKIDHLLEREEHDAGYQAFVHIRKIWPELKGAVARQAAAPQGREASDIIQECADIADKYDDCGGAFIAEKIRDLKFALTPAVAPDGAGEALDPELARTLTDNAAYVQAIRNAVIEQCAKIIDAEASRILSKQTPTNDPLSMTDTINANLRMMACILPELSASVRALAQAQEPGKDKR